MPHAARQQIVRYDIEDEFQVTQEEAVKFSTVLREQISFADAALISDYGYGVVTPHLAAILTRYARAKPVTLDSRYNLLDYPGVTAATPNEEEPAAAPGTSIYDGEDLNARLDPFATTLRDSLDCEAVLVPPGTPGMAPYYRDPERPPKIPSYAAD